MSGKRLLNVIGVILVVLQLISYYGMSKTYVGLYPSDDCLYFSYVEESDLTIGKALFAIRAGVDRFGSGFGDLTHSDDIYRVPTDTQYASAMVRESLGRSSGGSGGLLVYDTILTISYCSSGILGIALMIISASSKKET